MNLKKSSLVHLFLGLSFFISGLSINLVQLILYYTLAFKDIHLFRRINYYLTYSSWSQIVALAQWWANVELTIYYPDEKASTLATDCSVMCLMNHSFEIDWICAWLAVDFYRRLGSAKSFVKKSLRFLPIFGLSWQVGEFAFLERNLEKDAQTIVGTLEKYYEFPWPVELLVFAEGTRFTKEKHENSLKFAKERGLPELKHHLLPRPRGFNLCVKTFKESGKGKFMLGQLQVRFSKDSPKPTFMALVNGESIKAHLYVRLFPVDDVPTGNEKETTDFLYELYKKQDDLADYFLENDQFPGYQVKVKPRYSSLLNWLGWCLFSAYLLKCLLIYLMFYSSWLVVFIVSIIFAVLLFAMRFMINSTKMNKSSSYGMNQSKKQK